MSNDSEQRIMDAALKIFSEEGYVGATTMAIAEEAGLSEKTLFRRFKTKENLFNLTISKKGQGMMEDFDKFVLVDRKFDDPREVLESVIFNIRDVGDNYFYYFHLSLRERTRISEPFMEEFNYKLGEYLKKNISREKIDYMTFGLTISSFLYMVVTEKRMGRSAIDLDFVLGKFIDNLMLCI